MEDKTAYQEIEEQLLKEGFVSPEEMAEAKKRRDTHVIRSQKPLGLILLDQEKLSPEQLMKLLSIPDMQARIGKRAVERNMITQEQLEACEAQDGENDHSLSRNLLDKGYLSDADRKKLIYEQLGTVYLAKQAIKHHLIQENDLEAALKLKSYQKSTCEILYERNLITLSELNHAFRKFSRDLKLGQILFQQGLITDTDLENALAAQAAGNQSLGKVLLEKRYVAIEQLYFALSIQYNTPFQKLDGYVYYEKQKVELRSIVGQRYAYENLILPLFQSDNNLTLGVSNPANIWSMHGLQSLFPELQMTCVLITDEKFEQLYALLYGEALPGRIGHQPPSSQNSGSDAVIMINAPMEQQAIIKTLYHAYKIRMQSFGYDSGAPEEEGWFVEFIVDSYQRICEKYGCTSIQYRCDVTGARTEIFASPVL